MCVCVNFLEREGFLLLASFRVLIETQSFLHHLSFRVNNSLSTTRACVTWVHFPCSSLCNGSHCRGSAVLKTYPPTHTHTPQKRPLSKPTDLICITCFLWAQPIQCQSFQIFIHSPLHLRSANCSPLAKAGPPPLYVNKVPLEQSQIHLLTYHR